MKIVICLLVMVVLLVSAIDSAPQMDFREDAPVADQMSADDTEMIGCNHPPMVVLDKDGHRVDFSDQPQQKLSTEEEDM